jgi:hypothetical protein
MGVYAVGYPPHSVEVQGHDVIHLVRIARAFHHALEVKWVWRLHEHAGVALSEMQALRLEELLQYHEGGVPDTRWVAHQVLQECGTISGLGAAVAATDGGELLSVCQAELFKEVKEL